MYVILCYDINQKRAGRVRKIVKKYLHPVQKSVYEGDCTEKRLAQLKMEIAKEVDPSQDTVHIYAVSSPVLLKKEAIGCAMDSSHIIE